MEWGNKNKVSLTLSTEAYEYVYDLKKRSNLSISQITDQILLKHKKRDIVQDLKEERKKYARRIYSIDNEIKAFIECNDKMKNQDSGV